MAHYDQVCATHLFRLAIALGSGFAPLRDIDRLDAELETGRQVFLLALDLLDQPQELYRQAGPALRKTMNQTIFTKLMLDGATAVTDELAEPFDVIVSAGRAYDDLTYYRKRPPALTGVVLHEGVSANDLTLSVIQNPM